EAAGYASTSLQYASEAYTERAYQDSRGAQPNYVKYNSYVQQSSYYNSLAMQSRNDAESIEKNLTFVISGT
ncbi:MAG TPA: hypothetical protein VK436_05875, partial [Methanocella sp.]|nr:hypothetical protein [Methanocella sp.]